MDDFTQPPARQAPDMSELLVQLPPPEQPMQRHEPDELQKLDDIQRLLNATPQGNPRAVEQLMPPDMPRVDPQIQQDLQAQEAGLPPSPVGAGPAEDDEPPGIIGKIVGRLFGTDVNDPMPWTRLGTTIAGSLGGAYAGSQVPGGPMVKAGGIALGSVAGTVAGAAAPEMTMEALEKMGLLEEGSREKSGLNDEQLMTLLEGEALLDVATGGALSAARLAGRGTVSLMTGANRAGRRLAEDAARYDIAMLPVQIGERQFARGYISVMGGFPMLTGALKGRTERTMTQIENVFRNIPARFGPLATYDQASASILRDAGQYLDGVSRSYETAFDDIVQQAGFRGITVRPVNTRSVTEGIMRAFERETPRGMDNIPLRVSDDMRDFKRFVTQTSRLLYEGTGIADQSMRQMATVLKTVDEKMAKYMNKSTDTEVLTRMERLRNAVAMDMTRNAVGPGARELSGEFARIDAQMTQEVNDILGASISGKLGIVSSATMRGLRMTDAGRSTDSIASALLRSNSPQAVDEVSRLVRPETMREITSSVFREALDKASQVEANTARLDVDKFADALGLNDRASAKFQQTQRLLTHSGGMTIDELDRLVEIARQASSVDIPNVSTFMVRSAALGGIRRGIHTALPISGAAMAGYQAAGVPGAIFNTLITAGGSMLLGNMISKPTTARLLSRVLDKEASLVVKRTAAMRATQLALSESFQFMSAEQQRIMLDVKDGLNAIDKMTRAKPQ